MPARQGAQRPARSYFQQNCDLFLQERLETIKETYSLAQVLSPVRRGCRLFSGDPGSCSTGDERDFWSLQLFLSHSFNKAIHDPIHHGGMHCVRDMQTLMLDAMRPQAVL